MLSTQNIRAVCLGFAIVALACLAELIWFKAVIGRSPLLLLMGPELGPMTIKACALLVVPGSFALSLCMFRYLLTPAWPRIALALTSVTLAFPLMFVNHGPVSTVPLTLALVAATSLAVLAAAAIARTYPRRAAGRELAQ